MMNVYSFVYHIMAASGHESSKAIQEQKALLPTCVNEATKTQTHALSTTKQERTTTRTIRSWPCFSFLPTAVTCMCSKMCSHCLQRHHSRVETVHSMIQRLTGTRTHTSSIGGIDIGCRVLGFKSIFPVQYIVVPGIFSPHTLVRSYTRTFTLVGSTRVCLYVLTLCRIGAEHIFGVSVVHWCNGQPALHLFWFCWYFAVSGKIHCIMLHGSDDKRGKYRGIDYSLD